MTQPKENDIDEMINLNDMSSVITLLRIININTSEQGAEDLWFDLPDHTGKNLREFELHDIIPEELL